MPTRARRIRTQLVEALASAATLDEVTEAADLVVRPAIGAHGGAWSTVDPATLLGTTCTIIADLGDGPVRLPHDPQRERDNFDVEWEDCEPNTFHALIREGRVAAGLRRDVPDVRTVPRVRDLLEPMGATDELRALLATDGRVWGTVVFLRFFDPEPFGADDVEVLAACAPVIGQAVRTALLRLACAHREIEAPPGSLLLGADDQVMVSSEAAEELLATLDEHHARTALASLAAAARRRGPTTTRVTGSGGTLLLHASVAKGVDGALSVVVEQPRPLDLAPLIVEAFDLTAAEREVAELVLQGYARSQMARTLRRSEHTVGDQLKSVYRKAGVGSRAELCAVIFGTFYERRRAEGAAPGPYGFFLGAT